MQMLHCWTGKPSRQLERVHEPAMLLATPAEISRIHTLTDQHGLVRPPCVHMDSDTSKGGLRPECPTEARSREVTHGIEQKEQTEAINKSYSGLVIPHTGD